MLQVRFMRQLSIFLIVCFCLSSCSFQSPDVNEQRALIAKDAFPGGLPTWVSRAASQGSQIKRASAGLIPLDYSTAYAPSTTLENNIESERSVRARLETASKMQVDAEQGDASEKASPLARVHKLCPSLDSKVNDAVTTLDINARIQKLSALTTLCSDSGDLWLWLGKDYYRQKKMTEASNALQRVISIEGSSKEASELLAQINEKK